MDQLTPHTPLAGERASCRSKSSPDADSLRMVVLPPAPGRPVNLARRSVAPSEAAPSPELSVARATPAPLWTAAPYGSAGRWTIAWPPRCPSRTRDPLTNCASKSLVRSESGSAPDAGERQVAMESDTRVTANLIGLSLPTLNPRRTSNPSQTPNDTIAARTAATGLLSLLLLR